MKTLECKSQDQRIAEGEGESPRKKKRGGGGFIVFSGRRMGGGKGYAKLDKKRRGEGRVIQVCLWESMHRSGGLLFCSWKNWDKRGVKKRRRMMRYGWALVSKASVQLFGVRGRGVWKNGKERERDLTGKHWT